MFHELQIPIAQNAVTIKRHAISIEEERKRIMAIEGNIVLCIGKLQDRELA